ncbi:hypothetical protein, partial [Belnapia rosea]
KIAASVVGSIGSAVTAAFTARRALAAPPETAVERAVQVLTAQPALLDEMLNFRMVIREELERSRVHEMTDELRGRAETARDFLLGMPEGPRRLELSAREFMEVSLILNKLAGYGSAAIFPSYAVGCGVQLLLAKMAMGDRDGPQPADIRRRIERHRRLIAGWTDSGRPTNPAALAAGLQPEIFGTEEWLAGPSVVRLAETVVRTDTQVPQVVNGQARTVTESRWHVNELSIAFLGFDAAGEPRTDRRVTRTLNFAPGAERPYRYAFRASVGHYPNATPVEQMVRFPCLTSNDSWTSWEAQPDGQGRVQLPNGLAQVHDGKRACIADTYRAKRARLLELRDQEAKFLDAQAAMVACIEHLGRIEV